MKNLFTFLSLMLLCNAQGQTSQNYCDFEGVKFISFADYNGVLDTNITNPDMDTTNGSAKCAKYIRDTALYDNIKFYAHNKFIDVDPWVTNAPGAPKLSMLVWTTAAPGTKIEVQLGTRTNTTFPGGIYSIHMASTYMQRKWHLILFNYFEKPAGGFTMSGSIDKIVVLFNPNTNARDTVFFDDPTGPAHEPVGLFKNTKDALMLHQNMPNPANGITAIKFQMDRAGQTSLRLFDVMGKEVSTLLDQYIEIGIHEVALNTAVLPPGIYFYELKKDMAVKTMKLVVVK
jgi:hypothetical protein